MKRVLQDRPVGPARRAVLTKTRRVLRVWARRLIGERGATSLEYLLLLGAIVLPMVVVLQLGTQMLVEQFREVSVIVNLPLP